jgi:hypothetical protein
MVRALLEGRELGRHFLGTGEGWEIALYASV